MAVVPPDVSGERPRALAARGVGEAVGPLAQQRLDQRLCLAVRPGRVGAGVAALDFRERALEEGRAVLLALARKQFAVGEAGVVVDRDVQMLPASAAAPDRAVAMD